MPEDSIAEALQTPPAVIGERIKKLRLEKGWTQKFLAKQCSISAKKLGEIEAGNIDGYAPVASLVRALGISIVNLADESLKCNRCGDCCRMFAVRIPVKGKGSMEGPVLFYNLHEGIHATVQREKDGTRTLVIQIRAKCSMLVEHLDGTTSCKLYWMRPPICKTFPTGYVTRGADTPRCSMMKKPENKDDGKA
jgi:Fe-S-cluster containining protein/DNA-binding XRE family transcriptional regulator